MDRRADLQLRLQKTVEGLSVVAIRQHAVFLAGYLINPFATVLEVAKGTLTWAVTLPIFHMVWWGICRIPAWMEKSAPSDTWIKCVP